MTEPDRKADYPIEPLFIERWSPRAFDGSSITDEQLFTLFEAARWAPSSFNRQPWRFVYAHRAGPDWERFLALLLPFNAMWARQASVLVFVLSDTLIQLPNADQPELSHSHSFDTGAAWAQLALQATRLGLHTHGMSGILLDKVRSELNVPDDFRVEVAIAIGRRGAKAQLPPSFQTREQPSTRKPVTAFVSAGRFHSATGELANTTSSDNATSRPQPASATSVTATRVDGRRVFTTEFIIGMVINTIVVPTLLWLAHVPPPATIGGGDGLIADAVKASGFAVLLMTIGVTLPMRARGRRGRLQGLAPGNYAWLRYTPGNVVVRAALFALLAVVFLAPLRVTSCLLLDLLPLRLATFTALNIVYGVVINLIVGPFIIRAAMHDAATEKSVNRSGSASSQI